MVFKLFKNVGLDLTDAFEPESMILQDVILLTEDFDGVLPLESPLVHSTQSLKMFLNFNFNGSWKDLFNELWNYKGSDGKDLIVYANRLDFCTLVVKYFKELYPTISDENLKKLYHLTTDRIGTTYGFFYNVSKRAVLAYRSLAVADMELDLIVKNTQHEGILTDEMKAQVPFEFHYADYRIHGKSSTFHAQYVSTLKYQLLDNFRRDVILEIKDALLSRLSEFYKYFPNVERRTTLMETLQDPQFEFLNDISIVQHDGANVDEDGNDVKYVLQRYGVQYLQDLFKQVRPYQGIDRYKRNVDHKYLSDVIAEMSEIILSGEYERLLESQKLAWFETAGTILVNKLRFNFLILEFFRTVPKSELQQFDLTGRSHVKNFMDQDLDFVGVISS